MSRELFGTDGIRGQANQPPMDSLTAMKVGMAAGHYFKRGSHKHRVVIGKDTRLSGYMIEPALTSGFIAMGVDVILLGPIPTPGVSMVVRSLRADLGVMISASHNPYEDNGIKLFDGNGNKLSDEIELEIEKLMKSDPTEHLAAPQDLGRAKRLDDVVGRYVEYVKQTFPKELRLDGLKIVIDCSNGASYKIAPTILWELGAEVIPLSVKPDGFNINKNCGSTYPRLLCAEVIKHGADIGIALDGDADRLVVCDEKGQLVDGDQIMATIAAYWKAENKLKNNAIAATIMSNMGMKEYLKSLDVSVHETSVGDRYVLSAMAEHQLNFGGEQSGHIIFGDHATTGDGLLAALQLLAVLVKKNHPASEVLHPFAPYPQLLENFRYAPEHATLLDTPAIQKAIKEAEAKLESKGRLVIRKSGTEPLIRVMAEARESSLAAAAVAIVIDALKQTSQKSVAA